MLLAPAVKLTDKSEQTLGF